VAARSKGTATPLLWSIDARAIATQSDLSTLPPIFRSTAGSMLPPTVMLLPTKVADTPGHIATLQSVMLATNFH